MADFGKLNFSVAFNPTSAFPIDARTIFTSYEDAVKAAQEAKGVGSTETVYYYGMELTVIDDTNDTVKRYSIEFDNTLKEIGENVYTVEVLSTDSKWEQANNKWRVYILPTTHKIKNIYSIVAKRKTATDVYENMIYSYKHYTSGSVAIIVDNKIDMKIIIKGEK